MHRCPPCMPPWQCTRIIHGSRCRAQIFNASAYEAELGAVRDLRIWTNEYADTSAPHWRVVPSTMMPESRHVFGCMFNMLFKPSPSLEAAVKQQLQLMFKSEDAPYVALHVRLGGAVGERHDMLLLVFRVGHVSHVLNTTQEIAVQ